MIIINNTNCNRIVVASLGDSNALPVNFTWFTLYVWLFIELAGGSGCVVAVVAWLLLLRGCGCCVVAVADQFLE
jgi:hypothetical protein